MRRILPLVAGALALALAVPTVASAHGRHHRHHHHHHKTKHARVKHFGGKATQSDPGMPEAGTVASFTGGVLTLTLADGSTVSGKVTDETVVNCVPAVQAPAPTASAAHHGGWGDPGDDEGDDDHGDRGHHGDCGGHCDATDLVPGTVVHEAILKLGGGGAEFKLVLLVKSEPQAS
jgi:hypothetical protein